MSRMNGQKQFEYAADHLLKEHLSTQVSKESCQDMAAGLIGAAVRLVRMVITNPCCYDYRCKLKQRIEWPFPAQDLRIGYSKMHDMMCGLEQEEGLKEKERNIIIEKVRELLNLVQQDCC